MASRTELSQASLREIQLFSQTHLISPEVIKAMVRRVVAHEKASPDPSQDVIDAGVASAGSA